MWFLNLEVLKFKMLKSFNGPYVCIFRIDYFNLNYRIDYSFHFNNNYKENSGFVSAYIWH